MSWLPHGERSDDAVIAKAPYFAIVDAAELGEECLGMLAEQWRAGHLGGRVRQFDRTADGLVSAAGRVIDIEDHLARLQMRIRQDLAGVLAGAARHAGRAEDAHYLVLRSGTGPFLDDLVERGAVFPAP